MTILQVLYTYRDIFKTHYETLHSNTLYCTAQECTQNYCTAVNYSTLHCIALQGTARSYMAPNCPAVQCSAVLNCIALYFTALYSSALYCTALNCTATYSFLYLLCFKVPVKRGVPSQSVSTWRIILWLVYTLLHCTVLYYIVHHCGGECATSSVSPSVHLTPPLSVLSVYSIVYGV